MSKTVSINNFEPARVLIEAYKQSNDKKTYIGSLSYEGKPLPSIQLPAMRIAFPLKYKDQPGVKLSLSVEAIDTASEPLIEAFKSHMDILETQLNDTLKKKFKVKKPMVILKPTDKYAPVFKLKFPKDLSLAMVDLDAKSRSMLRKAFTEEELEAILVPRLPVQVVMSFSYLHTALQTVLVGTVQGIAYHGKDLEMLKDGKSNLLASTVEPQSINWDQVEIKMPDNGKLENVSMPFALNGRSIRVALPASKVAYRLCYNVGDKPKLNLSIDNTDIIAAFKALDAKVEAFCSEHPKLKSIGYFPVLKEKEGYFPTLGVRFNNNPNGVRIAKMCDNPLWEGVDCDAISLPVLESLLSQGRLIKPVLSIRSVFISKMTISTFIFLEGIEICQEDAQACQFVDIAEAVTEEEVEMIEEEATEAVLEA